MKQKVTFATTINSLVLLIILGTVDVPFLFLSAFVLLMARIIKMYLDFTDDDSVEINENQPSENAGKLFVIRLVMQMIPILSAILCMYIMSNKKQILWQWFSN